MKLNIKKLKFSFYQLLILFFLWVIPHPFYILISNIKYFYTLECYIYIFFNYYLIFTNLIKIFKYFCEKVFLILENYLNFRIKNYYNNIIDIL